MHRALVPLALLVALTGCGGARKPAAAPTGPPRLAFVDRHVPLGFTDEGQVASHGAVRVIAVTYESLGKVLPAYLVEGPARPNRPGIVVVHGSGGDRTELLPRAVALAERGAVALAITEPSSAYPLPQPTTMNALLRETRDGEVADVVAVRRAADVLGTLPDVGPRLGYLGWSAGAKTGTFVAASDHRFTAFALLSAGADPVSRFVAGSPPAYRAAVRRTLTTVDPLRYLRFARPGSVMLLDGSKDTVVPHEALENMIHAAPKGTTVRWFPTNHKLNDAAYAAAYRFLLART